MFIVHSISIFLVMLIAYLLVGRCLTPLQMHSDPLDVLLEHVVVQESTEGGGGSRATGLDEEAADVARHKVVVEEDVTGVLDVEEDG